MLGLARTASKGSSEREAKQECGEDFQPEGGRAEQPLPRPARWRVGLGVSPQKECADLVRSEAPLVEMEIDDEGDAEESRQAKWGTEHKVRIRTNCGKIPKFCRAPIKSKRPLLHWGAGAAAKVPLSGTSAC